MRAVTLGLLSLVPLCVAAELPPGAVRSASIPGPSNEQAFAQLQSVVVTSVVAQGGLTGKCTRTVDLRTGRNSEEFALGIDSGATGFDGITAWYQDSAHRVRREGTFAMAAAVDRAYRYSMAYWFPDRFPAKIQFLGQRGKIGRNYDVYAVAPSMGHSFELWFDAETHLLSRTIEPSFYQTVTSYFSNFKPVQGIPFPFSVKISSGDSRFDRLEEVQGVQLNPKLDPQFFGEPKEGGPDFTLTSAFPFTMPFRVAANLVVVDATINGMKMPFILDTGSINILFPETVKKLGLNAEGHLSGFGGGPNEVTTSQVRVDSLELSSALYRPQVFKVYPFPTLPTATGVPTLAGILGYEIFKRFVVKVDYPRRELTFSLPDTFQYSGDGTVIPFLFAGNGVEVDGAVDSAPGKFIVDLGTTGSFILFSPWVREHRALFPGKFGKIQTTTSATGGDAKFVFATIKTLSLGNSSFHDVIGALSLQTSGITANPYSSGTVGAELFLKSVVIFDYQRQRVILESDPKMRP